MKWRWRPSMWSYVYVLPSLWHCSQYVVSFSIHCFGQVGDNIIPFESIVQWLFSRWWCWLCELPVGWGAMNGASHRVSCTGTNIVKVGWLRAPLRRGAGDQPDGGKNNWGHEIRTVTKNQRHQVCGLMELWIREDVKFVSSKELTVPTAQNLRLCWEQGKGQDLSSDGP